MNGSYEFKIVNCFVANLGNIPGIHCVSRLAFVEFFVLMVARPDLFRGSLSEIKRKSS